MFRIENNHYGDVVMGAMVSLITRLTIVYSIVYSGADQRNIKAPRHWPLYWEFTGPQMASNAENVPIWWRHHDGHVPVVYLLIIYH